MEKLLQLFGILAGVGGALLAATAVAMRLAGNHLVGRFEALTLLQGGMAAMVFACFCLLLVLVNRR